MDDLNHTTKQIINDYKQIAFQKKDLQNDVNSELQLDGFGKRKNAVVYLNTGVNRKRQNNPYVKQEYGDMKFEDILRRPE